MTERLFVGTTAVDALPSGDRGRAYGDGLFETMRVHGGRVPWWQEHWRRLSAGAKRLGLRLPDAAQARDEGASLFADGGDGVLKLILGRGGAARGYAPIDAMPVWSLSRHPLPAPTSADGIVLRWCSTRLAVQPALAGMKHCNRLEQVLARAEWGGDASIHADEGLMCDMEGHVVSATSANVFVLAGGRWSTPVLDRCGVAGICRAWVMGALPVEEARLAPEHLEAAEAVFLCNAVRGILPVARLGARAWSAHPAVHALRRRLAAAHPAFVDPLEDA